MRKPCIVVRLVRLRDSTADDDDINAPNVSYARLNSSYVFIESFHCVDCLLSSDVFLDDRSLIAKCDTEDLVSKFTHLSVNQLKNVLEGHRITKVNHAKKSELQLSALQHSCSTDCENVCYLFQSRSQNRRRFVRKLASITKDDAISISKSRNSKKSALNKKNYKSSKKANSALPSNLTAGSEFSVDQPQSGETFPPMQSIELRNSIISEWQDQMSESSWTPVVCASCGQNNRSNNINIVSAKDIDLSLLTNSVLPPHVLPSSYNLLAYDKAILHFKGMHNLNEKGNLNLCSTCYKSLIVKKKQPLDSLANFQYYGIERLPLNVAQAFSSSSLFDLMLICRSRCSKITHLFVNNSESPVYGGNPGTSQRYNYGNVAVIPQDISTLRNILPPSNDEIQQSMCALFIGGKQKPTKHNIRDLSPVLVSKNRVQTMLEFLISNNQWYQAADISMSTDNLNSLFERDETNDCAIPHAVEIGHLPSDEPYSFNIGNAEPIGATSDYTNRRQFQSSAGEHDFLMEAVGYTANENSTQNYQKMKAAALSWCLDGKSFLQMRGSSRLIKDDDPGLMSFAFPHLDPWGIGGFNHPNRKIEQHIPFQRQVSNLLKQHDSPFEKDPNFAFICWNIIQKAQVRQNSAFSIKSGSHRQIVREIEELGPVLDELAAKWHTNPHAKAETEIEKKAHALLNKLKVVNKDLHNSMGYKLCRRNEIRALIKQYSTPALFITINPSDYNNPLVAILAGKPISEWQAMSDFQRMAFIAKHPAVIAQFFDAIITSFIKLVLRYDNGIGYFGKCSAYYGMVETQGKGTLHCHMLIWLEGNPDPEQLRKKLTTDEEFKKNMFTWLEKNISCHLPDNLTETQLQTGTKLPRPKPSTAKDPRMLKQPQIKDFQSNILFEKEFQAFVKDLAIACNWHNHTDSCWKYLNDNDPRDDDHCRFRVNGQTRSLTELDPETSSILLRRLHPWINNYNDLILFLVQCNMDIKYIGSGEAAKALVYYVTDYITKQSLPTHIGFSALQYAIVKNNEKLMVIFK